MRIGSVCYIFYRYLKSRLTRIPYYCYRRTDGIEVDPDDSLEGYLPTIDVRFDMTIKVSQPTQMTFMREVIFNWRLYYSVNNKSRRKSQQFISTPGTRKMWIYQ